MRIAALLVACSSLVLGGAVSPCLAAEPSLRFRGAGATRASLDAMQLKPFDAALWSELSGWEGKAPTPEELNGKVVMLVTWSEWYGKSHPAMRLAQSLYERHKGSGLVVIGVHNPRGGEKALENAKSLGVTFPVAQDKDGKFRAGLKADQDPNVYFIDRAGNLRYAQVDTGSAAEAAAHLVGESVETAKDYPAKLSRDRTAAEKERWKTGDASAIAPGQELDVPFEEPDEETYKKIKWPYFVGKVEQDRILETWSNTPPKLELVEDQWIPAAPKTKGKMVVVYFIDPKEIDMLNAIPVMNRLQDRFRRDVSVACVAVKIGENGLNVQGEEAQKLTTRNTDLLKALLGTRSPNHPLQPQPVKGEQFEFQTYSGQFSGIPLFGNQRETQGVALLLSTDHKVRWIGSPWSPDLPVAIDKVGAVDPAVKARRAAEDLHSKTGGHK